MDSLVLEVEMPLGSIEESNVGVALYFGSSSGTEIGGCVVDMVSNAFVL